MAAIAPDVSENPVAPFVLRDLQRPRERLRVVHEQTSRHAFDPAMHLGLIVLTLPVIIVLSIAIIALEQAFGWVGKLLHLLATALKYVIKFLLG